MNPLLNTLVNPFQFVEQNVRTAIDDQHQVWFCAKDVCLILEITWSGPTLQNIPEDWVTMLKLNTVTGDKDAVFINTSGLFRLVLRSNKPNAETFSKWVCGEVLPEIWRTGYCEAYDIEFKVFVGGDL
ncbi:BRO family protein [Methylobacter sp. S3L5C]|uniref:BRO-N domain-containing protein n=1 Tax=Methylobacter sp. S3L5C TaxID=2839024 RepID=UPI001FAE5311|nr:BRO family protein [Methylobacter sp. S3L5C]UOA08585.1 hypothetical protein KKZ03_20740 [Methylobacter sp. S3L5C]